MSEATITKALEELQRLADGARRQREYAQHGGDEYRADYWGAKEAAYKSAIALLTGPKDAEK